MILRFLGTGTSSGVPAIACDCRVCTSTDQRDTRLRAGAALQFIDSRGQDRVILIDATPDLRQQALAAKLRRCDAVLFTHNHVDHTFGVDELRRFNVVQQGPIEVFADAHTMGHLRRVYQHIFEADRNVNDSFVASLLPRLIEPGTSFELFGLRITPFKLLHGKLPILGYRFDASSPEGATIGGAASLLPLAYCTDVSGIPPDSWKHLRGLRTLVLDALRHRRHPTHFTLGEATSVAHEVGAAQTYFVHMSHDVSHEETDAELPETMHLAYDGLVLGESLGLTAP